MTLQHEDEYRRAWALIADATADAVDTLSPDHPKRELLCSLLRDARACGELPPAWAVA